MPDRAAIVTGASRGIGLAIAEALAEEGYALTLTARKPDRLEEAAEHVRGYGQEVATFAGNLAGEGVVAAIVDQHRERFGRLDVLVNNAGVGIGAAATEQQPNYIDLQVDLNLLAVIYLYRACVGMLREAGSEHGSALVVNLSSYAGKSGQPWLSVYSATKAGVIGYTQAMNKELSKDGVKSVAFCPAFVDTEMTDFIKSQVAPDQMISTRDIAEAVKFLLRLSPGCLVPEIVFQRPQDLQPGT